MDVDNIIMEDELSSSILNNISALGASRQLGITSGGLQQTIQRLTTGSRINRASDDAAGLAIGNKLNADIKVAGQGQRNANDAISYLQVGDGVLDTVTNLITRAAQLAQQAQTGTVDATGRGALDAEFQNILSTIIGIGQGTTFNGGAIFTGTTVSVAVGGFSAIALTVGAISTTTSALGLSATGATTTSTSTVSGATSASGIAATAGATPTDWALNASMNAATALYNSNPSSTDATLAMSWMTDAQVNFWSNNLDPTASIAKAKTAIDAYVAAHPTDVNGLATQAAITYDYSHPPVARASDPTFSSAYTNNLAAAAAANGNFTVSTTTTGTAGDSLLTVADAVSTAAKLTTALTSVNSMRGSLGASMQQVGAISSALGIQVENFTSAYSQIHDANIADEVVNLSKFQILNQSGISALKQSSQAGQQILALIQ